MTTGDHIFSKVGYCALRWFVVALPLRREMHLKAFIQVNESHKVNVLQEYNLQDGGEEDHRIQDNITDCRGKWEVTVRDSLFLWKFVPSVMTSG